MVLIVGLGNPGKKFQKTRHNLGFQIVDEFLKKNDFPKFRFSKKSQALISEGKFFNQKIILAKPQTFMNLSGKSIKSLMNFYNTTRTVLVVIHDDIDLPLGKIRIVKNRGSAGHKGVESIIKELKTKNFVRFRVGICPKIGKHPKHPTLSAERAGARGRAKNIENFVLQKFNRGEEKAVKEVIKKSCLAIEEFLREGLEKAMTRFNV